MAQAGRGWRMTLVDDEGQAPARPFSGVSADE